MGKGGRGREIRGLDIRGEVLRVVTRVSDGCVGCIYTCSRYRKLGEGRRGRS